MLCLSVDVFSGESGFTLGLLPAWHRMRWLVEIDACVAAEM